MSAKAGFLCAIALTVLAASMGRAQDQNSAGGRMGSMGTPYGTTGGTPQTFSPVVTLAPAESSAQYSSPSAASESVPAVGNSYAAPSNGNTAPVGSFAAPGGLSSWITYSRPDCCGPIGGNGPIGVDLYVRTGPSIPAGSQILEKILETGWDVTGGGRSLFFNSACDAAWTADLSLTYIYNHAKQSPQVLQIVPNPVNGTPTPAMVSLRTLHRTFANAALGREWYLMRPDQAGGLFWRAGFDAGGRLGTAKVDFVKLVKPSDTIYGYFAAIHTDVEKPFGCCTAFCGFRAEWDQTLMDFLAPFNNSNLQDVNLLITFGVRY